MVDLNKMKRARATGGGKSKRVEVDPRDLIGHEGRGSDDVGALAYDHVEHVTDKAALIVLSNGNKVWVPKSQIVDADDENIVVTKWWADKNDVALDW